MTVKMNEDDDQLLRQFVKTRSAGAFEQLVRRHAGVVYAAALRQVRDRELAEDVTQAVFIVLVDKAANIQSMKTIGGWLLKVTRYAAIDAMRKQEIQRRHERSAAAQTPEATNEPESAIVDSARLAPVLDDAMSRLKAADRDALVLRYFQDESFSEIGRRLGLGEDASRKRVDRALKKLRGILSRRGITFTVAAIAAAITTNASAAVPPPLIGTIVTGIGAGVPATGLGLSIAKGAINMMAWAKIKFVTAVASAAAVVFGGGAIFLSYAIAQQQPSQQAPTVAAAPQSPPANQAAAIPPRVFPIPDQVPPALVTANNHFAMDLYRQFNSKPDENAFFSPYSISTAVAMTWAGANGNTAAQMAKVMHFSELDENEITPGFGAIQQALAQAQKQNGAQLAVANSLWPDVNPEHPFLAEYMSRLQNELGSVVVPADYQHRLEESRLHINQWVEDKTKDKIKDLIHPADLDASTRLVLVNAIYFKGAWSSPFQERLSAIAPFTLADGSSRPVVMMNQTFPSLRYAEIAEAGAPFQMISMQYFGDPDAIVPAARGARRVAGIESSQLSMLVLVPRSAGDLPALEKGLSAEQITAWLGQLANTRVQVYLPRFRIEQRYILNETLAKLGMMDAFSPGRADFSGMNGQRDLSISIVIHQTFVDVNEQGTEAAAATAIGARGGGVQTAIPVIFRADHPFLFLIRENTTGSILFMGRLSSPAAADPSAITTTARGARGAARGRNNPPTRGTAPTTFTLRDPKAAATAAMELIQEARKHATVVSPARPALDGDITNLESAARALLSDTGADTAISATHISQFADALNQAATVAGVIAVRPNQSPDIQEGARQLEAKLTEIEKK